MFLVYLNTCVIIVIRFNVLVINMYQESEKAQYEQYEALSISDTRTVLGNSFKSEFEQSSLNSSSKSSSSSSSSLPSSSSTSSSFLQSSSFSSSSFSSSSSSSFLSSSSSESSDYANGIYEHPGALDLSSKGINIGHLNVQGICGDRLSKFSERN